ncbi:MAG TPA: RNA polymerase sigma factor [Solirubrobacterales bacterium]|nr:RNA polymerase sigma factor [Solirubrobacterales bacterium]
MIANSLAHGEEFAILFDRHFAEIHRFIRRRLGDALADDVSAETFLRAFKARAAFDVEREDARPWLYGIATNVIRTHARTEARRIRAYARTQFVHTEDFAAGSDDRVVAGTRRRELAGALRGLNKGDRDVLLLHAWAGLSHGEIAEALSIPDGTARSRLARVRTVLSKALGPTAVGVADEGGANT